MSDTPPPKKHFSYARLNPDVLVEAMRSAGIHGRHAWTGSREYLPGARHRQGAKYNQPLGCLEHGTIPFRWRWALSHQDNLHYLKDRLDDIPPRL